MSEMRLVPSLLSLLAILFCLCPAAAQSSSDRGRLLDEIESLQKQGIADKKQLADLFNKEDQFLSPAREDSARFAVFLQQPDTGLIMLNPRGLYDKTLTIRGGGAYYSFLRLTHEYGYGSDIELQNNSFSVGFAGADWGFMTALPDTPIESVTLETAGVRFPARFNAPRFEPDAREWYRASGRGFNRDGFDYKRMLPAAVDTSYILRSISYNGGDVLVVFRPVRKDADGSMTILWKILKRFPARRLGPPVRPL